MHEDVDFLHVDKTITNEILNKVQLYDVTEDVSEAVNLIDEYDNSRPCKKWLEDAKETSKHFTIPEKITGKKERIKSNSKYNGSWFNIEEHMFESKELPMFDLDYDSFIRKTGSEQNAENIIRKGDGLKTLKFRLYPSERKKKGRNVINEVAMLDELLEQYRWYYNYTVACMNEYIERTGKTKLSYRNVRTRILPYYRCNLDTKECFLEETQLKPQLLTPYWDKVHERVPRGALHKFVSSFNAMCTNVKSRHNKKSKMRFASRKKETLYCSFEDDKYPSFINDITGVYNYRSKSGVHKKLYFKDVINDVQKPVEIIKDQYTGIYYLHYPVPLNYYPSDDRRRENQAKSRVIKVIALDPGVRKFQVGYDPTGSLVQIGNKSNQKLLSVLKEVDNLESLKRTCFNKEQINRYRQELYVLRRHVKNLVKDLHWKTISYLTNNYTTILLPEFATSQMMKSKVLPKSTKRVMTMYSFYSFRQRFLYKAASKKVELHIVNESFTSKGCTRCLELNDVGRSEVYNCKNCNLVLDRDVNGGRNIFVKNTRVA